MIRRDVIACLFITLLLLGCSSDSGGNDIPNDSPDPDPDPPTSVDFQRGPMLVNWADNIIIPATVARIASDNSSKNNRNH